MSPNIRSASASELDTPSDHDGGELHANWSERLITVIATSLAVLVVATVAVLMGMA